MSPPLKQKVFFILGSLFLCAGVCLSACSPNTPTITPTAALLETQAPYLTPTPRPTPTPTLPALGAAGNPVTIGFVLLPEDRAGIEAAEDVAFLISEDTDYAIESLIYPDFTSLATAVLDGDVDLFWLEPLEYLYLNGEAAAKVLLMSNHLGVFAYGVQFIAHDARGFTAYFDPETGQSQGDALTALQQFSGTRPCFLNPDSLPGYYAPQGLLAEASTPILDPVFTYDYSATVRALYIQGICDFGIGYALIGDPRTAGDILQDIPEAQDLVEVIWQTEGIIPNTNLSTSPDLPLYMQVRLQEAFLDLAGTPEGLPLLSAALTNYEVEALKVVTDDFYNPLRAALVPLELDLQAITTETQNAQ